MTKLSELTRGERARVQSLSACPLRRRLMDIGLIDGTEVECLGKSPLGDPAAYLIRGAVIAISALDASNVEVCQCR